MTYITKPSDLPPTHAIAVAETAKIAVLRPTARFQIVTADNPDMIRTLDEEKKYVAKKIAALQPQTADEIQAVIAEGKKEFQHNLSTKAFGEQQALIEKIKSHGIPVRLLVEDKGTLEHGKIDFYTDQIFATDTGQYYDKNGALHFIEASFKNKQRQGEERLATAQATNLGATVQTLRGDDQIKLAFEGGDIRQMIGRQLFFIGHGHRSGEATSRKIAEVSNYIVVPIKLLDKQFYHLDCCFMPLPCDAAVLYEGEYLYDENNQYQLDNQGWPQIKPGTETMTAESRALIRAIYPAHKLVLISKFEALAYATNAVVLQKGNRFKMFVNGREHDTPAIADETAALTTHQISYTAKNIEAIKQVTAGQLDIVATPYSTMHGSGGSVRCTVLELACTVSAITPHKGNSHYFSDALDKLETQQHQMQKETRRLRFFKEKSVENTALDSMTLGLNLTQQ